MQERLRDIGDASMLSPSAATPLSTQARPPQHSNTLASLNFSYGPDPHLFEALQFRPLVINRTALGDGAGNINRMLKISAHRLDGSSGSQRLTSMPQQMQWGAAGGVGVEVGRM